MKLLKTITLSLITAISLSASQFGDINLSETLSENNLSYTADTKYGGFWITNTNGYEGFDNWYAYNDGSDDVYSSYYDINGTYISNKFQPDIDMNTLEVWKMGIFGKDVKVGFIENSYDTKNPDINDSIVATFNPDETKNNEVDFRVLKNLNNEEEGKYVHGLDTTSVLASKHDDFGTAGIAPKVKLYLATTGGGLSPEYLKKDLQWFFDNGVRVVNISLGIGYDSDMNYYGADKVKEVIQTIKEFRQKGMIIVVASGNENTKGIVYKGFLALEKAGVIYVGSILPNGERWTREDGIGSDYGEVLDFVAPTKLRVDRPLDYCDYDGCKKWGNTSLPVGTSLSAPLVAGTIALMLEVNPDLNSSEIVDILAKTAIKLGSSKFPLKSGKTYEYKTCSEGMDKNTSYNVEYIASLNTTYDSDNQEWYYNLPQKPYDTVLCQKYSWNNELGYGLVDSEGAVREAINRIKNPNRAKDLLEKNKSGYYHFPTAVLAKLGQISGLNYANYTNSNNSNDNTVNYLVSLVKSFSDTNWHLLGANKDTNADDLIQAGAKTVWVYRNGKWYGKAKDNIQLPNGVETLTTVKNGEGVWILSTSHIPQTPTMNKTSSTVNNLLKSVNNINDNKWHLLGANTTTQASDLINAGAKVVWTYKDNKWFVKTTYNVNIPDNVGNLDSIKSNDGVWVVK